MKNKKLKIYTSPDDLSSVLLKKYLIKKNISYEEINILNDKEKQEYIMSKTDSLNIPIIELNDNFIVGFNKKEINDLIKKNE